MKKYKVLAMYNIYGKEVECLEIVVFGEENAQAEVTKLTAQGITARYEAETGAEWYNDNNWIG